MENFEQDIPMYWLIAGFSVLMALNYVIRKKLRQRSLVQQGQLFTEKGEPLPIQRRVAGNRAWSSGKIAATGLTPIIILWVVFLVWSLTFGVSFIKSLTNQDAAIAQKIVLGVLSLGAFVFLYFAIRFTMRRMRFGQSWCQIDGKAGILGKDMDGKIITSKKVDATGNYVITIQCLETYTSGSGKNSKTTVNVLYQGKETIPYAGINSQRGIPFSISIPSTTYETGYQLTRGKVSWQLKIDAPVQGVDYSALFLIPVFKV